MLLLGVLASLAGAIGVVHLSAEASSSNGMARYDLLGLPELILTSNEPLNPSVMVLPFNHAGRIIHAKRVHTAQAQ